MSSLGLAMIAQNEETHIPATIAQFFHVVDDVVLVDGGSKDDTVLWAERMGARVFHRPFPNDFSDQKNYAISLLETDWVYLHDPDERLEPTLLEIIPYLVSEKGQRELMALQIIPDSKEEFDCFGIARKNFINGQQTEVYPDYQYRLFRNYCRYEGKVHEKIVGYNHRTEVDFTRPENARPISKVERKIETIDTERGQIETGVSITDLSQISRFNILHYKSSNAQERQDELYRKIREGK